MIALKLMVKGEYVRLKNYEKKIKSPFTQILKIF